MQSDVSGYAGFLKVFVQTTGPIGAIIAAVIVGLGLALIFYARSAQLYSSIREQGQKGDLLDHFATEVDRLAAAEGELGGRLERVMEKLERVNAQYDLIKDQQRELQTKVELMRSALRRAVDLLRAVREGRIAPEAIDAADITETGL